MIIYSQIIDVYKESLMGAFRSFDSVIVPSMFVLYMILICANYVRSETEGNIYKTYDLKNKISKE